MQFDHENYAKYLKEYTTLTKLKPDDPELKHRIKILREWLDNELDKWKNRQD